MYIMMCVIHNTHNSREMVSELYSKRDVTVFCPQQTRKEDKQSIS